MLDKVLKNVLSKVDRAGGGAPDWAQRLWTAALDCSASSGYILARINYIEVGGHSQGNFSSWNYNHLFFGLGRLILF